MPVNLIPACQRCVTVAYVTAGYSIRTFWRLHARKDIYGMAVLKIESTWVTYFILFFQTSFPGSHGDDETAGREGQKTSVYETDGEMGKRRICRCPIDVQVCISLSLTESIIARNCGENLHCNKPTLALTDF